MLFNFKAHIYHISLLIWIHTKTIKVEKFQTPEKTPKEKKTKQAAVCGCQLVFFNALNMSIISFGISFVL